jgi:transcriptional regulator with XRE-family HTH domain
VSDPTFADRVRYLRERRRLSQGELALLLGVDRTAIVHWERGRSRPRDIDALARALGLTVARFYAARIPAEGRAA